MKTNVLYFLLIAIGTFFFAACGDSQPQTTDTPATERTAGSTGNPAIDGLSQKIQAKPNDPELYYARSLAFYENEGYDEAIMDAQKAIQLDTLKPDYFHHLADVYLDYFKSRLALNTMEEAARRFPDRIPTLLKLSEFQLILNKNEESMKTIDRILKLDPQNSEAFFMFGMNFKETGDTNRAINSFQEAVSYNPDLVDAWINLGQLYSAQGNQLARTFYDNAIEVAPNSIEALHAKAEYLSDQEQLDEAIAIYKQINVLDPQFEAAYFNTGLLYLDLDSIPQAYNAFDVALKVSPTFIMAYYYRGVAAEMQGRLKQAKSDYEQALRMAPNYDKAQEGVARLREVQ